MEGSNLDLVTGIMVGRTMQLSSPGAYISISFSILAVSLTKELSRREHSAYSITSASSLGCNQSKSV